MSRQDPSSMSKVAVGWVRADQFASNNGTDPRPGDGNGGAGLHNLESDESGQVGEADDPPQVPIAGGATGPPFGGNRDSGGGDGGGPIDWAHVIAAADKAIVRGRRYWGPNMGSDPAPNSLSLADCVQQAILDVLRDERPTTHEEAVARVTKRVRRVWKTYLETSLRQSRIRKSDFGPDLVPTLSEVFDAAVASGDAATVFHRCFSALAGHRNATTILYIVLHDGCDWRDHARMKIELGLTTAEIHKAKSQIVDTLKRILR